MLTILEAKIKRRKRRRKPKVPLRFRLLGLLRKFVEDSEGAWLNLDLEAISVTLDCSVRTIQRCLNEIREEEEMVQEFVFRSANKAEGRGRVVMLCSHEWYSENEREAFAENAKGADRNLRTSFRSDGQRVEGVRFSRPTDNSRTRGSKEPKINNTRVDSLRVLSHRLARECFGSGWEDRYRRLMLTHIELQRIIHRFLKEGYWRDDIFRVLQRAFRIADTACSDGLAKSPLAYAVHIAKIGFKDVVKSVSKCRENAAKYWKDQLTFQKKLIFEFRKQFGEDYEPEYPPKLVDACQRYGISMPSFEEIFNDPGLAST